MATDAPTAMEVSKGFLGVVLRPLCEHGDNIIIPHLMDLKLKEVFFRIGERLSGKEIRGRCLAFVKSCSHDLREKKYNNGQRVCMGANLLLAGAVHRIVSYELEKIKDEVMYQMEGYEQDIDLVGEYGGGETVCEN